MRYKVEPISYPLYVSRAVGTTLGRDGHDGYNLYNYATLGGGDRIIINLSESLENKTESDDEVSSNNKLGPPKALSKQKSFNYSIGHDNSGSNTIVTKHSLDETQMINNSKLHLKTNSSDLFLDNPMCDDFVDQALNKNNYFVVFEGSSVIHVVSTQLNSDNTLVSIIPQHNKEENIRISLYTAYRNVKAQKFNDCYSNICKLPQEESFSYENDGVTSVANDLVENLHDIHKCYTILSTFINLKLVTIGNSPDCKLNVENRLNYLIRFHIDVQYSLGFLVVLIPDEFNNEEFDRKKTALLSYLKELEFYVLYRLFDKIYTIGPNNELDMQVDILPNEPSFLYFASCDTRDNNFIREYTNKLVSHSTCKDNNYLSINQKICVITNIFLLPPFSQNSRSNNGSTELKYNNVNDSLSPDHEEASMYSELARLGTNDQNKYPKTIPHLNNEITSAGNENVLLSVSTSLNQISNYELENHPNIKCTLESSIYKDSEISKIDKKRGYVTIKSTHLSVRDDPSIQVDKTTIQKFFSTKHSKAEADITHERYRKGTKAVSSPGGTLVNSSCKSNKYLEDFLLKSCSTSADSNDMYTERLLTDHCEKNPTSKSLTHLNQPYLRVTSDSTHPENSSAVFNLKSGVNCKSSIICNASPDNGDDVENDQKSSNLYSCASYAPSNLKKKTKFKTQNLITNKLKNKPRHSTFGHNENLTQKHIDTENVNIREFLDKEITHLDNDTSFKNNVQFKNTKKQPKIHLGLGLFKKDKVYSDISPNFRESKQKNKHHTHHADRNSTSKQSRLTAIKNLNNSSDLVFNSQDNFNRSINCLFANNEMDLQTEEMSSFLFNVDTWSNMVEPKIIKKLGPKETKRQDVIYELIYTENQYIRTLKTLYHVMYKGLQNFVMISTTTADKLMPNLASLIAINGRFLADLRARQNADENYIIHSVSDIFNSQFSGSVGDYMAEIYAQVCLQKHSAVNLYKDLMRKNSDFDMFVNACANRPQLKRLTIPEVIAFITQRPLKYPLLIQEILKCTKEDTSEYENLTIALSNAKNVIKKMNNYVTEYENAATLDQIRKKLDPKLEWNYNDSTLKIDDIFPESIKLIESQSVIFKTKQRCYDVVLVALRSHFVFLVEKDQKYTLLNGSENPPIIPMQNLLLRTVATDKKAFFLVDKYHAHMYEIVCANVLEKTNWIDKINRHLKENPADIKFVYHKNQSKS